MSRRHRMRRQQTLSDDASHDRWLISYADFITLLFAFFVVMYAISSINQSKYQQLSSALVDAFQPKNMGTQRIQLLNPTHQNIDNLPPETLASTGQLQQKTLIIAPIAHAKQLEKKQRAIDAHLKAVADHLLITLAEHIHAGKINVQNTPEGVRINMLDGVLFGPGSAEIESVDALLMLKSLVPILKESAMSLRIEGHTDNIPIHNIYFQSNWALSAMRATQLLEVLHRDGIEARYLSAVSYGAAQPVATNSTPQGRSQNRRVAILLIRSHAM